MIENYSAYKRMLIAQYTVESTDISGYSADVRAIPVDSVTVASPSTPTGKIFIGEATVKTSLGVVKTGFLKKYNVSGGYAGYYTIQEGSDTFADGDIITIWGTLASA